MCRGYTVVTYTSRSCDEVVFRDMMSGSLVNTVGTRHAVSPQKTVISVATATRTSNITNLLRLALVKEGYH